MKKLTYICILIAAMSLNSSAQQTPANTSNDADAPIITFESDNHDFGTLKQGDNGTCEFKFTNTGKTPLIISNAKGSCGCTVPEWPKDPIKPGETSAIKATYDTKRIGAFTKTVTVTSNAKDPSKILTIHGVIEGENPTSTMPLRKDEGAPFENSMKSK
jgi:hypothetical protein